MSPQVKVGRKASQEGEHHKAQSEAGVASLAHQGKGR